MTAVILAMLVADYSPKERALGEIMAKEVLKIYPVAEPSAALGRLRAIASRLAPDAELKIMIISGDTDDTCEPKAAPAGYLFVPEGLLRYTRDESELAAMMAHGIWHATEGALIPSMVGAARLNAQLAADAFAVKALRRAGYNSAALARYLRRVQAVAPSNEISERLAQLVKPGVPQ